MSDAFEWLCLIIRKAVPSNLSKVLTFLTDTEKRGAFLCCVEALLESTWEAKQEILDPKGSTGMMYLTAYELEFL